MIRLNKESSCYEAVIELGSLEEAQYLKDSINKIFETIGWLEDQNTPFGPLDIRNIGVILKALDLSVADHEHIEMLRILDSDSLDRLRQLDKKNDMLHKEKQGDQMTINVLCDKIKRLEQELAPLKEGAASHAQTLHH